MLQNRISKFSLDALVNIAAAFGKQVHCIKASLNLICFFNIDKWKFFMWYSTLGKFLSEWQELAGAFIGGIMGFLGAQLVAYKIRKRDEIIAAKIIVTDIIFIKGAIEKIKSSLSQENEKYKTEFVLQYFKRQPALSPLFDSSMITVMPLNYELSLHLSAFRKIHLSMDSALIRMQGRINAFESSGAKLNPESPYVKADIDTIYNSLQMINDHSECVEHFLNTITLTKFPFITKLLLYFRRHCKCKNSTENKCNSLLKLPEKNKSP